MIKDVPLIDLPKDEYLHISQEGLRALAQRYDAKDPVRNVVWTTDINAELPIVLKTSGPGNLHHFMLTSSF
jgi:hypothetical protein